MDLAGKAGAFLGRLVPLIQSFDLGSVAPRAYGNEGFVYMTNPNLKPLKSAIAHRNLTLWSDRMPHRIRTPRPDIEEANSVTVCVAAISDNKAIYGASDRMLTSGNIEFQQNQRKIWNITNSIIVMTAGDIAIHADMLANIWAFARERVVANPKEWLSVALVAEEYAASYAKLKAARAEFEVLRPLNLTLDKFVEQQRQLADKFISDVTARLIRFQFPDIEAIVAGIDSTGVSLYVIRNEQVSNYSTIGFASIGIGAWHANSQMMFSGHSRSSPGARTMLHVHRAKKKAEVAPGVGPHTDMVMVGPLPGMHSYLKDNLVASMDVFYSEYTSWLKEADEKSEKQLFDHIKKTFTEQQVSQKVGDRKDPPTPSTGA